METGPFIDYFPIKTSVYKGFSMAMLNNQMVYVLVQQSKMEMVYGIGYTLLFNSDRGSRKQHTHLQKVNSNDDS